MSLIFLIRNQEGNATRRSLVFSLEPVLDCG